MTRILRAVIVVINVSVIAITVWLFSKQKWEAAACTIVAYSCGVVSAVCENVIAFLRAEDNRGAR